MNAVMVAEDALFFMPRSLITLDMFIGSITLYWDTSITSPPTKYSNLGLHAQYIRVSSICQWGLTKNIRDTQTLLLTAKYYCATITSRRRCQNVFA